jgi:hypothetical protein
MGASSTAWAIRSLKAAALTMCGLCPVLWCIVLRSITRDTLLFCVAVQVSSFKRPEKPLVLYEFQGCPFCKKVWPIV